MNIKSPNLNVSTLFYRDLQTSNGLFEEIRLEKGQKNNEGLQEFIDLHIYCLWLWAKIKIAKRKTKYLKVKVIFNGKIAINGEISNKTQQYFYYSISI